MTNDVEIEYVPAKKNDLTKEELDSRLKGLNRGTGRRFVGILERIVGVAITAAGLTYLGMSLAYGPYDAGKVIYAETFRDKSLKHRHIEEAKATYAKNRNLLELNENDLKFFYLEIGAVATNGRLPSDDDVSWYQLLDWIEDN